MIGTTAPEDQITRQLSLLPLFEGQCEETIRRIATITERRIYRKGQLIFSEGDPGAGFHIVTTGRVKIFKLSTEGKEQILHIFGPGEPFGEAAVFAGTRFPAFAEAIEQSSVLFLPRQGFVELVRKNPSLAMNMLAVMSLRLRRFAHMIEDLSLKEVPGRLATYLLLSSERARGASQLRLDLTKVQLASLIGTIPETLSRILAKMANQHLIRVDGPNIEILDRAGLTDLAAGQIRLS